MTRDLTPLLRPASIAIVGASSREQSLAGRPLTNLQRQKYPGRLYPINPQRDEIAGLKAYPSIADLPEAPDLALIISPSDSVLPALEACAERGVRAAIVISAGFGEIDQAGAARQRRMAELARSSGMVLLGPNCIGALNFVDFIPLSFTDSGDMDQRKTGRIALVSQSGGLMGSLSNRAYDAGVGLSYGLSTGNEADLTAVEALEWLAGEGSSDAFILLLEQVQDGARFMALCRRLLELGKPLVAYKMARTETGGAAARSHTGALAGSYRALQAVFRQLGVIEATDLDDVVDLAAAAAAGKWPKGPNVGIVTGSGGAAAASADRAEELGMATPPFSQALEGELRAHLPGFAEAVVNPFDCTAMLIEKPASVGGIVSIMLSDPGIDAVVSVDPGTGIPGKLRAESLAPVAAAADKPVLQAVLSGSLSRPMVETLRAAKVPVFSSPTKAVDALAGLWRFGRATLTLPSSNATRRSRFVPATREGSFEAALAEAGPAPGEYPAKRFLARFGIPVVDERLASSAEQAIAAAEELDYPVAVKVHTPDITHKTEAGGVRLNLRDAAQVREAYAAMPAPAVVVARMADVRLELLAGFHTDPTFGPLVLLGLGGIWAEALDDVAMRPAPLSRRDVAEMAAELRGAKLLRGFRNLPPVRMDELERVLLAISDIAVATQGRLSGIDVNPLAVLPDGSLLALDASLFPAT
ncbi:MAG TPA: acetate--CoA ligase family protein [Chloroflexota bacterium]|nr:acetate--CoA ligase family protein [Chloroflexota bacterium]